MELPVSTLPIDRRTRKRLATRQTISDAATRLFNAHGFDQVTVDEIAEAADVGRMTVFNHFPRKEDMLTDATPSGVRSRHCACSGIRSWRSSALMSASSTGARASCRRLARARLSRPGPGQFVMSLPSSSRRGSPKGQAGIAVMRVRSWPRSAIMTRLRPSGFFSPSLTREVSESRPRWRVRLTPDQSNQHDQPPAGESTSLWRPYPCQWFNICSFVPGSTPWSGADSTVRRNRDIRRR